MKRKMSLALCGGRHNIPQAVDGSVFSGAVDPLDIEELESRAEYVLQFCSELNLYVTGLTVAQNAVLNVCRRLEIPVVVWHFNRDTGDYYPQEMT